MRVLEIYTYDDPAHLDRKYLIYVFGFRIQMLIPWHKITEGKYPLWWKLLAKVDRFINK